jgi:hypothetical protein
MLRLIMQIHKPVACCTPHGLWERAELCRRVCHYLLNTCSLFTNIVCSWNGVVSNFILQFIYSIKLTADYWTMNGRKKSWPNVRDHTGFWLKVLGKMIKIQDSLCPDRYLNWLLAAEMLPLGSVHFFLVYSSACRCKQYVKCPHYLTFSVTARR